MFVSHGLGVGFQALGKALSEVAEILVQDVMHAEEPVHGVQVADRAQAATKEDAVKSCYNPVDAALVPFQKALHGFAPDEVGQTHHEAIIMERHFF
jgi:hypothetical protein